MMIERTIALEERQAIFIKEYEKYGFHSSDDLVAKALDLLQEELTQREVLDASAELYAEIYSTDELAQEWTHSATQA